MEDGLKRSRLAPGHLRGGYTPCRVIKVGQLLLFCPHHAVVEGTNTDGPSWP